MRTYCIRAAVIALTAFALFGCSESAVVTAEAGQPSDAAIDPLKGDDKDARGNASRCAMLCQRSSRCGIPLPQKQCEDNCEEQPAAVAACTSACVEQPACDELLVCMQKCGTQGPAGDNPYGSDQKACGEDAAGQGCPAEVIACTVSVNPKTKEKHSACMPFCDNGCPAPSGGNARPICDTTNNPNVCRLHCVDTSECPDGMTCVGDDKVAICLWPVK